MKRNNKKGFTIVELVIVIAVIAILAGVLIPTFGGIVKKSQESAEVQKVSAAYKEALAIDLADGKIDATGTEKTDAINGYQFTFTVGTNGAITNVTVATTETTGFSYSYSNGAFTATKSGT
jgi:type IV pilus assembly protein PilA